MRPQKRSSSCGGRTFMSTLAFVEVPGTSGQIAATGIQFSCLVLLFLPNLLPLASNATSFMQSAMRTIGFKIRRYSDVSGWFIPENSP